MAGIPRDSLFALARVLCILGAIILAITSILGFFGSAFGLGGSPIRALGGMGYSIIGLILAFVSFIGSSRIRIVIWDAILVILGFVGGGFGGALIIISALLALVMHYL